MAPIKFEEHIKDTLEKRAITPNDSAWDKLSERLDAQENKKPTKAYWWLGIAASIVIIVVANHFLNSDVNPNTTNSIQIVNEDDSQNQNPKSSIEQKTVVTKDESKVAENDLKIETDKQNERSYVEQNTIAEVKTSSVVKKQDIENKENQKEDSDKDSKNIIPHNTTENTVAQVETPVNEVKSQQVDNEIEALLGEAKASIASKTPETKEKSKINPDGLLEEVEFDLDQSFRDKVFQKLKSSYKMVSTAVAHRND